MQEILITLSIAAAAAGLIVAGINIAKGKKKYVEREEYVNATTRIHNRIDNVEERFNGEIKNMRKELSDKVSKVDTKIDALSIDIKSDMKEVFRAFGRIEGAMNEWKKS